MDKIILELNNIYKQFDHTEVLKGISISIRKGEFITLLGPSGCGKTTTLRIIAGLEYPDKGTVILSGKDVTDTYPEKRDVNTVFQNYALFPHMNVAANIGYSLKLQHHSKEEIRQAVKDALEIVQLQGYEKRMPSELSGGQKQRVAIARALINKPSVLLLDEPLGALDLQLRRQMQLELKQLQKKLGITFIYITHDQEEALTMSDRIAVMRDGCFEQIGTPAEIYDKPLTSYVAKFVGEANILQGKMTGTDGSSLLIECAGSQFRLKNTEYHFKNGDTITVAVRSESIEFSSSSDAEGLPAVICEKSFAGGMLRIKMKLNDGTTIIASRHGINLDLEPGDRVKLRWEESSAVAVDVPSSEASLSEGVNNSETATPTDMEDSL